MNKIVREQYPVARLPEDLRQHLDPSRPVTVVIEQEDGGPALGHRTASSSMVRFYGAAKDRNTSVDEAVSRIRELRDRWD